MHRPSYAYAVILVRKRKRERERERELLYFNCVVAVVVFLCPIFMVPWVGLRFVIVAVPGHTPVIFEFSSETEKHCFEIPECSPYYCITEYPNYIISYQMRCLFHLQ